MIDKDDKDYIDSNFNRLSLSDMYACKLQVHGGLGGSTNWLSITNEQAKAIHAILAGDRVLGHDPHTQIVDVWSIEDVQGLRDGVSDEQALEVLQSVEGNFDATEGTTYDNLRDHLQAMFPEPDSSDWDNPCHDPQEVFPDSSDLLKSYLEDDVPQ